MDELKPCAHCGGDGHLSGKQYKFIEQKEGMLPIIRWKILYRCGKCKSTSSPIITDPTFENFWNYKARRDDGFFSKYDALARNAWNRRFEADGTAK